jgi:hypothetical protein
MRTTKSTVTFKAPFTLNKTVGELPPGTYDIEIDEEEIVEVGFTAYRRVQTLLLVRQGGSTRSVAVEPKQLDAALERDLSTGSNAASN